MTNLQADRLIESGQPLKKIVPLLPTKIAPYQYFANSMSRRFALPDSRCAMCGRECNVAPVHCWWRANLHTTKTVVLSFLFSALALLGGHLYSRWVVVEFATLHRFCADCQRRYRLHTIVISVVRQVLLAILILVLLLTVPAIIFLLAVPFIAPKATWLMLAASVVGVGLLALVVWAFEKCRSSLIPNSLRQIGRLPFFLYGVR